MNDIVGKYYADNYERHVNIINKRTNNYALAEDIVQSAFAQAIQYLHTFSENRGSFAQWFSVVLYGVYRRYPREKLIIDEFVNLEGLEDRSVSLSYVDNLQTLKDAIQDVRNPKHRMILEMRFLKEYKCSEIALVSGLKRNTVEKICRSLKERING